MMELFELHNPALNPICLYVLTKREDLNISRQNEGRGDPLA